MQVITLCFNYKTCSVSHISKSEHQKILSKSTICKGNNNNINKYVIEAQYHSQNDVLFYHEQKNREIYIFKCYDLKLDDMDF